MKLSLKIIAFFAFFMLLPEMSMAADKQFTVVIDPGHGGHDSGAKGKFSKEKNINLTVALKVGNLIKYKHPDIKVIYTRKKDVFIPLQRRADIANENKADFFISIHTNSAGSSAAVGTETYLLGLHKTKSNLEVAMRENSVITLEDDYKTKYQGFNPNSIDSYIMFEYMQDRYLNKSLQLAELVEKQFGMAQRHSRGVRQAGFWVLHKSACPSVLIELGFISNPAEERFLNSDSGTNQLALAISNAFDGYKKDFDRKSGVKTDDKQDKKSEKTNLQEKDSSQVEESTIAAKETASKEHAGAEELAENKNSSSNNQVVFKIQLFSVARRLPANHREFRGLKNVGYYKEGGLYKYTYGVAADFDEIEKERKKISKKFPKAFVVAFDGDQKISVKDARKRK